ncbi:MAG: hydrogenase-4 component E [Acidocella sp.]|nr:hydrogenase-4 component E [Acidocella sp.]
MTQIYPIAHLLGGVILLCAFALLSQRRISAMITLYQAEAITLSAAAFWQGLAQGAPSLYLTGLITLGIKAILLPIGLRRIVWRFGLTRANESALPLGLSLVMGVGLIGVAVLVVLPTTVSALSLTREDLAISLSIVLLGLLVMTSRRHALAQVIGFLSLENGLVLAATGMPDMPFVAELTASLLVLLGVLVVGVFLFRMNEHFDSLDLAGLEDIERRGR